MKNNLSFYILAFCLLVGSGLGVYFVKINQLSQQIIKIGK